ncbi:MAG: S41 family peptidase [Candidatus Omnitrophica bacterium]|nr:S41 family peptidase [Candidatus Omnitrophota bacterium]
MRKVLVICLIVIAAVAFLYSQAVNSEEQKKLLPFGALKFAAKETETDDDNFYKEIELFTDALTLIRGDYVEETKYKELIYGALKGMLQSLDPYSQFLDPDEYKEVKVETEGEFGGLGIEITIKDSLLTIISPIDDTPAFRVGLKANDRIVKIEDELTRNITLMEAVKKLRGKPGTKVNITVMREGAEKLLKFTITRDVIKIKSIRKAKLFDDSIGYIRLSEFQERSALDMEKALTELESLGMDSLVLDLRNNPGGLLNSAVEVAEKFIAADQVIVSTRGRHSKQDMVFKSAGRGKHRTYPLVVLISNGSASGSEIVAGAVQDYKRGILLGTKSFGKGSVQTVVPLIDGSALRLTTSKYFTPSGRCIHEEGIEPDVAVEFREQELEAEPEEEVIFEQIVEKEVEEKDSKEKQETPESEEEEEEEEEKTQVSLGDYMQGLGFYDNQLVRAVDLLKGIKLYREQEQLTESNI